MSELRATVTMPVLISDTVAMIDAPATLLRNYFQDSDSCIWKIPPLFERVYVLTRASNCANGGDWLGSVKPLN